MLNQSATTQSDVSSQGRKVLSDTAVARALTPENEPSSDEAAERKLDSEMDYEDYLDWMENQ